MSDFAVNRRALASGVSAVVVAMWSSAALAQDAAAPETDADAEPVITVTGSRLATTGMDTPVPVTAVQAEELEAMDPSSLIASVSQLPQFYGNQTPNNSAFFTRSGTGTLNLRGLGVNRTLTLLNGRRFPSSSAFGGVDINVFPEAMIKGIETVTGGASAAYGTDAVAGVTNFLLDTDFEGLEASLQGGITSRGMSCTPATVALSSATERAHEEHSLACCAAAVRSAGASTSSTRSLSVSQVRWFVIGTTSS